MNDQLQQKGEAAADRIIIATQVVEAGVDISARTLITELAPWASIVQRIGRCNRTGDDCPGAVFWIDLDEKLALPYEETELGFARRHLIKLEDKNVSPKCVDDYKRENEKLDEPFLRFVHKHVLRRRDLIDLFDTAPDLSGNDIDIQRFVRGDDPETDVQVFWRNRNTDDWDAAPHRNEICNVPVGSLKAFLKKEKPAALVWDHIDEEWRRVRDGDRDIRPGVTVLLPTAAGGYSNLGWDPESKTIVSVVPPLDKKLQPPEGTGSDPNCCLGSHYTIEAHTQHVCEELAGFIPALDHMLDGFQTQLANAARWHDVGKALWVCQQAMHNAATPDPSLLLAKSGRKGKLDYRRYGRQNFRHELGSALAVLQQRREWPFVVAYLIAAHHGRIRLSIRTLPGERTPDNPMTRFALGVWDGDGLPDVDLGGRKSAWLPYST